MRRPILIHTTWKREANGNWNPALPNGTLECTVSILTNESSVFRACRESWAVAQGMTEPIYDRDDTPENTNIGPKMLPQGQLKCRCIFKGNIVTIGRYGTLFLDRIASHFKLQGIRNLMVSTRLLYRTSEASQIFNSVRRNCPNLRRLAFTLGGGPNPSAKEDHRFAQIVKMNSHLTDLVHFISQMNAKGDVYEEFVILEARTIRFRADYEAWIEDVTPEWNKVEFNIGMIVKKRKKVSEGLRIRWDLGNYWTNLKISCRVGKEVVLDSRYGGLERLFAEEEPFPTSSE